MIFTTHIIILGYYFKLYHNSPS